MECLENDTRLTRSVHFWRDFSPQRMPIGVSEAAYVALSGILQTSFFGTGSTGDDLTAHGTTGRKAVAESIRAYWSKYKGLSLEERWFRMLADDSAAPGQWLQAMGNITRAVDVTVAPSSMFGTAWVSVPNRKPGEKPKLNGEKLRRKQNPSVIDLAEKRIQQIDGLDLDNSNHDFHVVSASDMALELAEWDAVKAIPILKKQVDYCVVAGSSEPNLTRIAGMAGAMARAGDHSGLKIYGDWLRTKVSPGKIGAQPEDVLSPLWKFQDDPAMIDTAEQMFNGPPSDWNPMLPHVNTGWGHESLLHSPLLGLKSFRDQMLRGLSDPTPYGTLTIRDGHAAEIKTDNSSGRIAIPSGDKHLAPVGTVLTLRTCDKYAVQISHVAGAPAIEVYWPDADRDRAVKDCAEFLRRYSERLRYDEKYPFADDFPRPDCHLTFPLLDHPAAAKEAESVQAIFSLENQGERRLVKSLTLPMKAKWVTLKKYPWDQGYYDTANGEGGVRVAYLQDCWVWQAEEVLVNGQWQRYYGVVGPHQVGKVAASEIEFPSEPVWSWSSLSGGADYWLHFAAAGLQLSRSAALADNSPVIVQLSIRNRSGVPQSLPTQFAVKSDNGKLSIRPGMSMTLMRLPEGDDRLRETPNAGTPVPGKPLSQISADLASRQKLVESGESYEACEFDVRDCFDLVQPGRYRLRIQFSKQSGLGEGPSAPLDIELK